MDIKLYKQTKVLELHIGLKSGQSKLVGHVNVREQLEQADYTFVEDKLFNLFTQSNRFELGVFYIVARVKNAESGGNLASLVDDILEPVASAEEFMTAEEIKAMADHIVDSEEDVPF